MGKLSFCERFIHLNRRLISFAERPYLPAIYAATGNLVLRCSRQTEKSTFLVNTLLYEACTQPGLKMLLVTPREEQARVFIHSRLLPALAQSDSIRRRLLGGSRKAPPVKHIHFVNDAELFVRAAYRSGDSSRGVSADLLLIDEYQDIAPGHLPVLMETMSHSARPRTLLVGTPKLDDNPLEQAFNQTTANEWLVPCSSCRKSVRIDERCLGPTSLFCPDCATPLDARLGGWAARNPTATAGQGYCICYPMAPWSSYEQLLAKHATYDAMRFKNEVLGLPTSLGEHVVTRAELEACCGEQPMAEELRQIPAEGRHNLVAGIDWGGGGVSRTVLVIGFMRSDFVFQVCRLERFAASEDPDHVLSEVARRCKQFQVRHVAADGGGNGSYANRLLYDRWRPEHGLFAILYGSGSKPTREGVLWRWMIDRTSSIGAVFTRVKKRQILFPRQADSHSFLDEFACEVAEYDDEMRSIRYSHPDAQQDDALHATNYGLNLAVYLYHASQHYAG